MNFPTALAYCAFFGIIGFAVWVTGTGYPLFALILTPSVSSSKDDE